MEAKAAQYLERAETLKATLRAPSAASVKPTVVVATTPAPAAPAAPGDGRDLSTTVSSNTTDRFLAMKFPEVPGTSPPPSASKSPTSADYAACVAKVDALAVELMRANDDRRRLEAEVDALATRLAACETTLQTEVFIQQQLLLFRQCALDVSNGIIQNVLRCSAAARYQKDIDGFASFERHMRRLCDDGERRRVESTFGSMKSVFRVDEATEAALRLLSNAGNLAGQVELASDVHIADRLEAVIPHVFPQRCYSREDGMFATVTCDAARLAVAAYRTWSHAANGSGGGSGVGGSPSSTDSPTKQCGL